MIFKSSSLTGSESLPSRIKLFRISMRPLIKTPRSNSVRRIRYFFSIIYATSFVECKLIVLRRLNKVECAILKKENREKLKEAIDSLDESMREIVILRELLDMSYEEISKALDIELGTVKSRLSRAREKLRYKILEQKEKVK